MSRPHPAQNGPAGNHRNPDGTSAPPAFRIPWPPPFGRFCPPPSAHPELSPRHAVSVSPPPSPEAESNSPRTSCSKSCLLYTSDAADEEDSVDLGGRRIIKKKKKKKKKA